MRSTKLLKKQLLLDHVAERGMQQMLLWQVGQCQCGSVSGYQGLYLSVECSCLSLVLLVATQFAVWLGAVV
jgi:hypothetical protein